MRICIECRKREGAWWDHVCKVCKNRPKTEKEALEYDKRNANKDILSPRELESPVKAENAKYNKLSIVGLVLSIIAIFGIGLAGLTGFILGIVSLVQIKYTHEKGKWLGIVAIVVGFIWSFITGIINKLIEAGF